jgi:hypothetical protein
MKLNHLAGAVLAASLTAGSAQATLLTFDEPGLQPAPPDSLTQQVGGFYAGANFSANGIIATGDNTAIANLPSGPAALFYLESASSPLTMMLTGGAEFTGLFSFMYTSPFAGFGYQFFGAGPGLSSFVSLDPTAITTDGLFGDWKSSDGGLNPPAMDLTGMGYTEVRWSGSPNLAAIDNVSFNAVSEPPIDPDPDPDPVPAPATLLLVALGMLGLGRQAKRG